MTSKELLVPVALPFAAVIVAPVNAGSIVTLSGLKTPLVKANVLPLPLVNVAFDDIEALLLAPL